MYSTQVKYNSAEGNEQLTIKHDYKVKVCMKQAWYESNSLILTLKQILMLGLSSKIGSTPYLK